MKKLLSVAFFLTVFAGLSLAQNKPVEPKSTFVEFEKVVHDFGKVTDTEDAIYEFKFVNTSGNTLLLNPPKTSCGCTASYYPKEPIAAGEEEAIKVKFSTKNRAGQKFNKTITVSAQDHIKPIVLTIKGEVVSEGEIAAIPSKKKSSLFK